MAKKRQGKVSALIEEERLKGKGQSTSCPFRCIVDMSSENLKSPRRRRSKAGTGTRERLERDSERIRNNPPQPQKNEMPGYAQVNPVAPLPAKKKNSVGWFENYCDLCLHYSLIDQEIWVEWQV